MALDETRRYILIKGIIQDPFGRDRVGGVARNQGIPALFGVEHFCPQLAPWRGPGPGEGAVADPLDANAPAQPERLSQSAGGVDGNHEHFAALTNGGHRRRRRGDGGLAHSPGAAHDRDFFGRQQGFQGSRVVFGAAHMFSSAARASAT